MPQIVALQGLRAAAALGVLCAHLWPNLVIGAAGVDLFFVISGFVMIYSSAHLFGAPGATSTFIRRRLIRIVPIYWLVTALYLWLGVPADWTTIVTSLFFIPSTNAAGHFHPIVFLGWTLNYEMMFYTIVAATIALPRRLAIAAIVTTIVTLVIVGRQFAPPSPIHFWGGVIILEFAFGCLIGLACLEGVRIGRSMAVLLCIAAATALALGGTPPDRLRPFVWGLPCAALVFAACLVARPWHFGALANGPARLLGDTSYALYLTHLLALGYMTIWGMPKSEIFASAILLGIAVHLVIERPITRALNRVTAPERVISAPA